MAELVDCVFGAEAARRKHPTAGAANYAGLANYAGAIVDWTLPDDDNGAAAAGR